MNIITIIHHSHYYRVGGGRVYIRVIIGYILGLYRDNGKENGNYSIVYWGDIRIMEKKMETTIIGYILGYI